MQNIINQKRSFSSPLIYELQAANLVKKKKKEKALITTGLGGIRSKLQH